MTNLLSLTLNRLFAKLVGTSSMVRAKATMLAMARMNSNADVAMAVLLSASQRRGHVSSPCSAPTISA